MSDGQHDHWVDGAPPPAWVTQPPPPPPAAHAGGLTDSQVIRIHALAAAVRSKPHAEPVIQLQLAARYADWIKNGPGDLT